MCVGGSGRQAGSIALPRSLSAICAIRPLFALRRLGRAHCSRPPRLAAMTDAHIHMADMNQPLQEQVSFDSCLTNGVSTESRTAIVDQTTLVPHTTTAALPPAFGPGRSTASFNRHRDAQR